MTDEQFNLLMEQLNGIKTDISGIKEEMTAVKENMLTKEDGLKVAETLEHIATETAATAEDKAEAGYTLMANLFKGLEDRIGSRFDSQDKQIQAIAETLTGINQLLERLVEKDELQDQRIWNLERKVSGD